MKHSRIIIFVILIFVFSFVFSYGASAEETRSADALYQLGLFKGLGSYENGAPNYGLDKEASRQEAVIMLIRLLGKEQEALSCTSPVPFNDCDQWAKPYVAYAYEQGLTKGVSQTKFGANDSVNENQFVTFVLRALGYDSSVDFEWNSPYDLANSVGLYKYAEHSADNSDFYRSSVVALSFASLDSKMKAENQTLSEKLISEGVFSKAELDKVKETFAKKNNNSYNTPNWESVKPTVDSFLTSLNPRHIGQGPEKSFIYDDMSVFDKINDWLNKNIDCIDSGEHTPFPWSDKSARYIIVTYNEKEHSVRVSFIENGQEYRITYAYIYGLLDADSEQSKINSFLSTFHSAHPKGYEFFPSYEGGGYRQYDVKDYAEILEFFNTQVKYVEKIVLNETGHSSPKLIINKLYNQSGFLQYKIMYNDGKGNITFSNYYFD